MIEWNDFYLEKKKETSLLLSNLDKTLTRLFLLLSNQCGWITKFCLATNNKCWHSKALAALCKIESYKPIMATILFI